jgi:hypothetical protein
MNTEKIKTLDQLRDAFDAVENARAQQGLSAEEDHALELASIKLRRMERSIIKMVQLELVDSLTVDSKTLKDLTVQIKQSSAKLSGIAAIIEKAAGVVESFIKIITAAASSGLL